MAKTFTFTAPAEGITSAIERVSRVGSKSAVQVLNGVHLALEDKELVAQMTDMSLVLRERIPVTRAGEGTRVLLDAQKVLRGLRTLDGTITFKGTKDALGIVNDSTTLRYAFGKAEDYPKLPSGPSGSALTCPREEFGWTFDTVSAALSKDQSRPVLRGLHMEIDEGRIRLAATDSFRLASDSCSIVYPEKDFTFGEAIVDGQDFIKVLRFLGTPEQITLSRDEKWLVVSAGGQAGPITRTAYLRTIEGQFPNYRQLIPDVWEGSLLIDRRAAIKAFDRIRKLGGENRPAKLEPVFAENTLLVSVRDAEINANAVETKIDTEFPTGAPELGFPYGINPAFMYDALQAIGADKVRFHYINPLRPCLVTEEEWHGGGIPDRFYLVMPIRLAS